MHIIKPLRQVKIRQLIVEKKHYVLTNFPLWSIVNANYMDPRSFAKSKTAPILYGIVQNSGHFDDPILDS